MSKRDEEGIGRIRWRPLVLSLVEDGWRGARQCSLDLKGHGVEVLHLMKGRLDPHVQALLQPFPHIRIMSAPRWRFRLQAWVMLAILTLRGRLRWVLVDHRRTLKEIAWWCRLWRVTPVLIRQTEEGYQLRLNEQPAALGEVFGYAPSQMPTTSAGPPVY